MENENSVEKLVERMEQSLKKKEEEKQEQVKLNKVEQNEIEPSKLKQTKNYGNTKKEKLKIKREKMKTKIFKIENGRFPFRPKLTATVSIALLFVFAPRYPAKNNRIHPITWPIKIARRPVFIPSGAKYVPVRISDIETPAPNQISPLLRTDVLFSSILKYPPCKNIRNKYNIIVHFSHI